MLICYNHLKESIVINGMYAEILNLFFIILNFTNQRFFTHFLESIKKEKPVRYRNGPVLTTEV